MTRKKLLYFIPGTLCNSDLWQRLWPLLSDEYQLVHTAIPAAGNMQQVVDSLVEKIRSHSAGQRFSLLGFSLGGYLASAISCQFDDQLEKLMVVANGPGVLPEIELQARKNIVTSLQGKAKAVREVAVGGGVQAKKQKTMFTEVFQSDHSLNNYSCRNMSNVKVLSWRTEC